MELRKYYVRPAYMFDAPIPLHEAVYEASEADAAFAEMRRDNESMQVDLTVSQTQSQIYADRLRESVKEIEELKQQHAEEMEAQVRKQLSDIETIRTAQNQLFERVGRKHAEEIERLKAELGIYRESLQKREEELRVCAGTIRGQAAEIERLLAALRRANDGCAASIERESALRKQAERYEKLRGLSSDEFRHLRETLVMLPDPPGTRAFDRLVDELPGSGEAAGPKCTACDKPLRMVARGERGAIYRPCDCEASGEAQK